MQWRQPIWRQRSRPRVRARMPRSSLPQVINSIGVNPRSIHYVRTKIYTQKGVEDWDAFALRLRPAPG